VTIWRSARVTSNTLWGTHRTTLPGLSSRRLAGGPSIPVSTDAEDSAPLLVNHHEVAHAEIDRPLLRRFVACGCWRCSCRLG
jgi:hypothetical protein